MLGLLALLAMVLQRSRTALWAGALALSWLYLCSTAVFADYLMGTLEDPYPPKALSVTADADVIVLLGGAIRGDTHMGTLGISTSRRTGWYMRCSSTRPARHPGCWLPVVRSRVPGRRRKSCPACCR